MNIVDPILYQTRFNPDFPAIHIPGDARSPISYRQLETMIRNASRKALALGLKSGEAISVLSREKPLNLIVGLGLAQIGVISCEAPPQLWEKLGISGGLVDLKTNRDGYDRVWPIDWTWLDGDGAPLQENERSAGGDLPCRIALTSGTTGEPKGVMQTHAMFFTPQSQRLMSFGSDLMTTMSAHCNLSLASSSGFRSHLYMLWRGGAVLFPGKGPEETAKALAEARIETLIAPPDMLIRMLAYYEANMQLVAPFKLIKIMGSAPPAGITERMKKRLCPNVIAAYGATEALPTAAAPVDDIARVPGAVGYIAPGQTVEVVDKDDTPLPNGQEGILRIRNEHMATEYINDPAATKAAFRNGWFYPGDIAVITEEQMIVLKGREKSVLFIGTSKINPEQIEAAALELPGVTQAGAFTEMGSHGIAEVWILVCSSKPIDVRAASAHFAQRLPGFCQPSRIIVSQQPIPINTMGRFDRSALPALAQKTLIENQRQRPN